ncbi:MAG: class I SAM-dependent methyltransferase [Myxococcota bacterium]
MEAARFWDVRADKYAKRPVKDEQSYRWTLDRTRSHLSAGDEVLEVGCGTGTTALGLAASVGRITASDVSSRMVEIASEKAATQKVENVRFVNATLFDDALGEHPFDAVLAFNLLHLLEDLPGAVRRVHRLLKPGGLFISKTVCLAEQSRLWGVPLAAMRLLGLAPYVRCLTIAELEEVVTGAGFEILETGDRPPSPPSHFVVARSS